MSSISAALGAQAAPMTIEWNGRVIELNQLKWKTVISALEMFLIERALRIKMSGWKMQMEMGLLTLDQLEERKYAFDKDCIEKGTYSIGSPVMMNILGMAEQGSTPESGSPLVEGHIKLVSLLTGLNEDEAISMIAAKKDELMAKLSLVMKMGSPNEAPKANGPATSPVAAQTLTAEGEQLEALWTITGNSQRHLSVLK